MGNDADSGIEQSPGPLFDDPALFRLIMENVRDLVRVVDTDFNFIYVSPSHETVLGYTVDELLHTSGLNILHPDDAARAAAMHREMITQNVTRDGLWTFQAKNGQWITLETRGKSLVKDGHIVGVVTVGRDVTERLRLEQEVKVYQGRLQYLAFHDALTGLPNRIEFFDQATRAIQRARSDGHSLAMLFVDCDDFKRVNDAYGHEFGDEVVKECSRRLTRAVRHNDTVARVGGDEFAILLPEVHSRQAVEEVVDRVMRSVQPSWDVSGHLFTMTVSVGVALYPADGLDSRTLFRHADKALYAAKNRGKNTFVFYEAAQPA